MTKTVTQINENMMNRNLLSIILATCLSACSVTDYSVKTDTHSQFSSDGNKVKVEQLAKSTQSWDGSDLPVYPLSSVQLSMLRRPMHEKNMQAK